MQKYDMQSIEIDQVKYKITCTIGEGGVGLVYHVVSQYGEQYALKMIRNYTKNPLLKQTVDSQIKIQQLFKGEKYVINYYGERVVGNNIFILFQLGQYSLRNKIEMNHLIQDEYIQMLIDVARGLMLIHEKKIIHRDIKPENVIYSKGTFKITDFGTSTQHQTTNEMAGTIIYWAPQLLEDKQTEFTQAVDIWSFGVMAFQAYFLIHPFFYNKNAKSNRQAIAEIKQNIAILTKNFTFGRLINHLRKLGYNDKAQFIDNKLQQTHESLVNLFKSFFIHDPKKRVEVTMLLATLQSIQQDQIRKVQVRTSRILQAGQLPADVNFFVKALNLSYKLQHDYYYKKHQAVEYHFELGLRLLAITKYDGKDFIQYNNKEELEVVEPANELYAQVKDVLSEYYFYLRQTKEIQFFQELPVLRILAALCSCWQTIREKLKNFLRKVELITNLSIKSGEEFSQFIDVFTERQLASIQNLIFSEYLF